MPKVSPIQQNFNTGEISPILHGRSDFDNYKNALALCLNSVPYVQGGVTRRPGTYFSNEVKDSTLSTRISSFKFSTTQAYIVEWGHQYVRFNRNDGPVMEATKTITGATVANPVVVTAVGHGYSTGEHIEIASVGGMTQLNGRRYAITVLTADTFSLQGLGGVGNVNGSGFTAYTSGGTAARAYTVVTPYVTADLFQLRFTQSADTLYIFHPSYAPRSLTRTSDTAWTLTTLTFLDGPYMNVNATTTTLTPSGGTYTAGATVTLTASAVTGINGGDGFKNTDVGRFIRLKEGSTWGYVQITGFTSTTVVTGLVVNSIVNANAKANWRLGLWSDTTGYPACGTFYEDRLMVGGNTSSQARLDGSRTGDYLNFAPTDTDGTVTDSHAVSFTLNASDVQVIRWMVGDSDGLVVGTFEGEWIVQPSANSAALSPTSIAAHQSTNHGSASVQAVRAGEGVLFVQKAGKKVRELSYTAYPRPGLKCPDMTVLAEHITKAATAETSGIKEMAYQQEPLSIVWAVRKDGVLLGFTYERDQKVQGWHRHTLGGYSNAGHTAVAKVESVAVISSPDTTYDEVWMVVQRYINGRSVRYIEYLTKMWERGDTQSGAVFVDCALTYNGSATTTVSGLWHVVGETVQLLVDGAAHNDKVVSATGTVTLDVSASIVQIGYSYNSDGQLLRLDAGAADGTAVGKFQRSHRVGFLLHDSLGLQVGANFNATGPGKLTELPFRTSAHHTSAAVSLFTGIKDDFTWEGDYTKDNYVCWRWSKPFPGTILAVMPRLHTQDA